MGELYQIVAAVVLLLGAGGFSHGVLSTRMSKLELSIASKLEDSDVRQMMDDKLAVLRAEMHALTAQVKEAKSSIKELNETIKELNYGLQKSR